MVDIQFLKVDVENVTLGKVNAYQSFTIE